jgi:hypothetical protein
MGRVATVDVPTLFRLWADLSLSRAEVAHKLGISHSRLTKLTATHKLPKRPWKSTRIDVDPTTEEIRDRKREMRRKHFALRRSEAPRLTAGG